MQKKLKIRRCVCEKEKRKQNINKIQIKLLGFQGGFSAPKEVRRRDDIKMVEKISAKSKKSA